jgi:hypothetical protein
MEGRILESQRFVLVISGNIEINTIDHSSQSSIKMVDQIESIFWISTLWKLMGIIREKPASSTFSRPIGLEIRFKSPIAEPETQHDRVRTEHEEGMM